MCKYETKGVKHAAHALSINQFRGFGFVTLYVLINFALLLFASSFDALTHYRHFGKLHRSLTCIGSFLILFTTTLQQLCHRGASTTSRKRNQNYDTFYIFYHHADCACFSNSDNKNENRKFLLILHVYSL